MFDQLLYCYIAKGIIAIRTIFNLAIREEIVDKKHYPFGKGKIVIKFPESVKTGLNIEKVKRIDALDYIEFNNAINFLHTIRHREWISKNSTKTLSPA